MAWGADSLRVRAVFLGDILDESAARHPAFGHRYRLLPLATLRRLVF